jgi:hypothetical protein
MRGVTTASISTLPRISRIVLAWAYSATGYIARDSIPLARPVDPARSAPI